MIDKPFIKFGKSWDEFYEAGLTKPGTEIVFRGKRYLIGDVNSSGGECDDCVPFRRGDDPIESYRVLFDYESADWDKDLASRREAYARSERARKEVEEEDDEI